MTRMNDLLVRSPGWDRCLANPDLARRVFRPQYHRISEIFPDVYANDPRYLRMTDDLVRALDVPEWEPEVDDAGLSTNFLTGSYDQLLSVSVHKKLPMSIGMEDNRSLRKELNVLEPDETYALIAHRLGTALLSKKRPTAARFRRAASTGIPNFAVGGEAKVFDLNVCYRYMLGTAPVTPVTMLNAGLYPVYIIVNRFQADKAGKVRYSWTGFERVEVDATTPYAGHHGMRVRTAYAMSGTVSYFQTAMICEQREFFLNEFEFTYKHRVPESVAAKVNKFKFCIGIDVTQFDQTVSEGNLDLFCKQLERFWHPRAAALSRLTLGGPSISACPFEVGKEDKWAAVGDPFDVDSYSLRKGLPSGHPLNPDIGKFTMSNEIIYRLWQLDPSVIDHLEDLLRGNHPRFGFLNSADDNLLLFNQEEDAASFLKTKGVFKLDEEEIPTFLGVVYGRRRGMVVGQPNLTSFLSRWLVPEQSLGKKEGDHRAFFNTAWQERKYHYDTHVRFPDMFKTLNEAVRKNFGVSVDTLMAGRAEPLAAQVARTYADRMFLMNASSIHYKIDIDDITPELANQFAVRLAPEQVSQITQYFHTTEVEYDKSLLHRLT